MRPDEMSFEEQLVASISVADYRRNQMADKIHFSTNVPETIALKYANGKRVESRYNDYEVYYTLADGRAMYATPALDAKIVEVQLSPNEPFTICKREVKDGNKKRVEWQVARVNQPEQQVARPAAPEQTIQQIPNGSTSPQSTTSGNGRRVNGAAPMTNAPEGQRRMSQILSGALIASIEALIVARDYARSKGLEADLHLDLNGEDVRTLASTAVIQYFRMNAGATPWQQ